MLARARSFLRTLLRRDAVQREIDEELRFHITCEIEELIEAGVPPEEARRRARASFGGFEAVRTETRQAHGTFLIESLWADLRYGVRSLRANPAYAATAILTMALSIGAVTAVLMLAYAFYWQRLPVPRAAELVELKATRDHGTRDGMVSYPDYLRFRDGMRSVRDLAAVYPTAPLFVRRGEEARSVNGSVVSANFFEMMEIRPALGRFFDAAEDAVPERDPVVVLGYDYWQNELGGDPSVVGQQLVVNRVTFTIVGVAPRGFHGVVVQPSALFLPTMMLPVGYRWCSVLEDPDCTVLHMYGRLRPGTALATARVEATSWVPPRWHEAGPHENSDATVAAVRGSDFGVRDRQLFRLLAWMAGVLLAVCCINLAGLVVARAGERARALTIRRALGASRGRILRQLHTEALLVAGSGAVIGTACALAMTGFLDRAFYSSDGTGRPFEIGFSLAPPVLGAVAAVALVASLLFGLLPGLVLTRRTASNALGPQGLSEVPRRRLGRWLVGAQAASAVTLVVLASLLVTSGYQMLRGISFDPSQVVLMRLRPRLIDYRPQDAQRYLERAVRALRQTPGVEAISMVGTGVALRGLRTEVVRPGAPPMSAGYLEIGPGYFETLSIPLLAGRAFSDGDRVGASPVAIVGRAMARSLWPDESPIGRTIEVDGISRTVVGLAADVGLENRVSAARPYVYTPFWQNPEQVDARLQIRVAGDPGAMIPSLAAAVHRVDPSVPITELVPMTRALAGDLRTLAIGTAATAYAGLLAIALCAIGLHAAMASTVAHRRREIGLRRALGATARGILRMITWEGMRVIAVGTAVGLGLAFVAARLIAHLLYGSARADGWLYLGAAALLGGVGLLACLVSARRAARVEPMAALRLD